MGGGDCLTLLFRAKSTASILLSGASVGVGGAAGSATVSDGDRLCLCRYDAEFDRGGCGLPVTGDRGTSSLYEDVRLMAGVLVFDDAGDCADGGV
jgi:hypothetical protein